jgi:hypothetical protein
MSPAAWSLATYRLWYFAPMSSSAFRIMCCTGQWRSAGSGTTPATEGKGRMEQARSRQWLDTALQEIWHRHFRDVPVVNIVNVAYCRPSKTRLGWIALSESGRYTQIGINRLLGYPEVPDDVCIITIAHELVHYGHGFGSPLPKRYADPHAGGIVERELVDRGLADAFSAYVQWSDQGWDTHYQRYAAVRSRPADRRDRTNDDADVSSPGPPVAALDMPRTAERGSSRYPRS